VFFENRVLVTRFHPHPISRTSTLGSHTIGSKNKGRQEAAISNTNYLVSEIKRKINKFIVNFPVVVTW
jgi:hypothetical protein